MFRRYNYIFIFILLTAILCLNIIGIVNQPLDGDLTRIGGFRENEFGWNRPQDQFEEIYFDRIENLSDFDRYYDVIVLGDSFTFLDQERSWLNHFADKTGLSVAAFHQNNFAIKDIVSALQYKNSPPRLFIVESVERGIISNILFQSDIRFEKEMPKSTIQTVSLNLSPLEAKKVPVFRKTEGLNFENRISEAASFLFRYLKRRVFNQSDTLQLPLLKNSLFTSTVNNRILIYDRDFEKEKIPQSDIITAARKIGDLEKAVENNGKTMFLLLVLPDKLTVYRDEIDRDIAFPGLIERLSQFVPLMRVDHYLQEQLRENIRDLYLPNDTHTSSSGNGYIADCVIEKLVSAQVLQ